MKCKRLFLLFVILVLLVGCGEEALPIAQATAVVPTETAIVPTKPAPTDTVVPTETTTNTPEPTETAVPTETTTNTPEPTATATNTPLPTPTHTATPLPPTATAVPTQPPTALPAPTTVPVAPPPPAVAPPAGNLLSNPGFEAGKSPWWQERDISIMATSDIPQFVHSGERSAHGVRLSQSTDRAVPGVTYQAGVWAKIWSSTGNDYSTSENPGDLHVAICIGTEGQTDPHKSVCSGFARPLDTWQYLTISAVAESDHIAVIFVTAYLGSAQAPNNNVLWDDASLVPSEVMATATPAPPGPPARPAAVPFDAVSLHDSMTDVRWKLEQMGGLLDRLVDGSRETCEEYNGYYRDVVESAVYHSVPEDWQGVYNEYIFAVENSFGGNVGIFDICNGGGGSVAGPLYGEARSNINESLERLNPAIDAANALLGG